MANQELENYIKKSLEQGVPEQEIKNALRSAGWQEADINEGFNKTKLSSFKPSPQEGIKVLKINETGKTIEKSNKKIVKIILISLVIIVLGVGGYFSYKYFMPKGQATNEIITPTIILTSTPEEINTSTATSTTTSTATSTVSSTISFTDCKNNLVCLAQASQKCSLAKATIATSTNILDIKQTIISSYEIKGYQTEKCIFLTRIEKVDLVFPASTTQDIITQQQSLYKTFEGREMSCKFNTADLTAMLNRWKVGKFAADDFEVAECKVNF